MIKNIFDIQINSKVLKKEKRAGFSFIIKIDGNPINDKHHVDLYEIIGLIDNPNKNYIYFWNCDCGIPDCAGIEASHIKKTKQEELMILIPIPCSINDFKQQKYNYWKEHHKKMVVRLDKDQVAKKLWDLSFELEKEIEKYSKNYYLLSWPATTSYHEYQWPANLPAYLRKTLLKNGYKF